MWDPVLKPQQELQLVVLGFISSFCLYYSLREKICLLLLAQVIWSWLSEDSTKKMVWYYSFNLNLAFSIKMMSNQSCNKNFSQLDKNFLGCKDKKFYFGFNTAIFLYISSSLTLSISFRNNNFLFTKLLMVCSI